MAVEWGIRQEVTIGKKWISVPLEEAVIIEPNVIYEFDFTVPEVAWWQAMLLGYSFDPGEFAISFKEKVAEETEIPSEEVKILYQYYSPEARKFQLQMVYTPSIAPVEGVPPAGFVTTLLIITIATGVFTGLLSALALILGVDIKPTLEAIKKLIAEAIKGIKWIAIPVCILGIGWIVSMFVKKKGG